MRRISRSISLPIAALLLALAGYWLFAPGLVRVEDGAGLMTEPERGFLARYHDRLLAGHDIDYRVVTARGLGDINQAAVARFEASENLATVDRVVGASLRVRLDFLGIENYLTSLLTGFTPFPMLIVALFGTIVLASAPAFAESDEFAATAKARSMKRARFAVKTDGTNSRSIRPGGSSVGSSSRRTSSRVKRTRLFSIRARPTVMDRSAMSLATTQNPMAFA